MAEKSTFALIIPCYNEEKALPVFKTELAQFIKEFNSLFLDTSLSIVFVDNQSTDSSFELLKVITTELDVKLISCTTQGYGAALRAGFSSQNADWYGFADLDNTYPLNSFLEMYRTVRLNNLQIIYANRLLYQTEMPWTRQIGKRFYSGLARILFRDGLQDMCTGMRIFNHSCLPVILSIKSNGLHFSIEFTAISLKLNWRRSEIPIHYRKRLGHSKLSVLKDGILFLISLLKVRWFYKV